MTVTDESSMRPEFRAHLEWQIASALRREERFAEPVARGVARWRTAAALVVALAMGAGAMAASGEVQEARQRDALIEAMRAEESLSRLRLQLAQAALEDAKRKFETGIAGRDAVAQAEAQLQAMKTVLARLALNAEEIKATAQAPRDDLQAPLVGQRDFVTERLRLDLSTAEQALAAAERTLAEARKRFDVGLAPKLAQAEADVEVAMASTRLQELAATLDLRQRALQGSLESAAVAAELRKIELTTAVTRLQRAVEAARIRLDGVRKSAAVGQAGELELKRAEVELLEREVDLQRLFKELEKIRR